MRLVTACSSAGVLVRRNTRRVKVGVFVEFYVERSAWWSGRALNWLPSIMKSIRFRRRSCCCPCSAGYYGWLSAASARVERSSLLVHAGVQGTCRRAQRRALIQPSCGDASAGCRRRAEHIHASIGATVSPPLTTAPLLVPRQSRGCALPSVQGWLRTGCSVGRIEDDQRA